MKIEDCRTEADLNKYREEMQGKTNGGLVAIIILVTMSIFAMFYGYYDAICELYKLIF
jgi:hypothetical protein